MALMKRTRWLPPLLLLIARSLAALHTTSPPRPSRSRPLPSHPTHTLPSHLYSQGLSKLRQKLTIGGTPCVDLLCWEFVKGRPCECDGERAHLFAGACPKALAYALGAAPPCTARCTKTHPTAPIETLAAWHREARGPSPIGTVEEDKRGTSETRSSLSAAGFLSTRRCTVPPGVVAARLQRHAHRSTYLDRVLREPFVEELLAQDSSRRLLAQRGAIKELSEVRTINYCAPIGKPAA